MTAKPPRSIPKHDLFEPAPPPADEMRIICKACQMRRSVPAEWPALLCRECCGDLAATAATVAACIEALCRRLDTARDTWAATLATSPAADRWPRVMAAMGKPGFADAWARRKAEGGAFAALQTAWEAHEAECDRIQAELNRYDAAATEINKAVLGLSLSATERRAA